jgi:hypothetical protein
MAVYASMCLDRPAGRPKPTPRNSRIRECAQPGVTGVRRRRGLGTNELARTRGGKTPHRDGTARRHRDVPRDQPHGTVHAAGLGDA